LKPLRRKMLQGKLNDISKGKIRMDYKMMYAK
jgi:peptide deformylase